MLEQFLHHIDQNKLFNPSDKILLAVSGGIDSMVMAHLFRKAGFKTGVAHVNFQLRGEESTGDEALVERICLEQNIPFYVRRFETENFADETGQSVQMAARELRYQFFNEVMRQHGYTCMATAHHLNDSLETVLLNLVRGTGLDGMTGISVKQNNLIRPLLFASRSMIEEYAKANQILWREDSSNVSEKYHRNLLRNQVIPVLTKMNPALEKGFKETSERINGASLLAWESIERFVEKAVLQKDDQVLINKEKLMHEQCPAVLLWEIIKDNGFNYIQCKSVTLSKHTAGRIYYSHTHQLVIDRQDLIISNRKNLDLPEIKIEPSEQYADNGRSVLAFETTDRKNLALDKSPAIAQLDLDKLDFPLTWRPWREGDHFIPFGMTRSKKLSDFLIDSKVSLPDKENVTVLESAGNIAWVIGYRVSDKFKIDDQTSRVLLVKLTGRSGNDL